MAYVLATAAALANAITSILQRSAAEDAPEDSTLTRKLIFYLLKRPLWLFGVVAMIGAFLLQAAALFYGQISTVQPILTTELLFLLAILWLWFHNPIGTQEWGGAIATAGGLALFLAVSHPNHGSGIPDGWDWLGAGGAAGLVALVLMLASRHGSKARRAALLGSAAAVIWAFTAALIKTMVAGIPQGWAYVFTHWPVYAVVVVGVIGLIVVQSAFQVGPLTASQPALVIVDPMASILIGVWLFDDRLASRASDVAIETVAMIVMFVGVFWLSRSPLIIGVREESLSRDTAAQNPPSIVDHLSGSSQTPLPHS